MHNYYRGQLAEAYIEPVNGFGREIPLCRMDTVARGAPYHIINTAMNLVGKRLPESVDATCTFTFTRKYCGSDVTDYCPTDGYLEGKYDLANAMAISGGALSPSQSHPPGTGVDDDPQSSARTVVTQPPDEGCMAKANILADLQGSPPPC